MISRAWNTGYSPTELLPRVTKEREDAYRLGQSQIDAVLAAIRRDPRSFTLTAFLRVLLMDDWMQRALNLELQTSRHAEFERQTALRLEQKRILADYMKELAAEGGSNEFLPELPSDLSGMFDIPYLMAQIGYHKADVSAANEHNQRHDPTQPRVDTDWPHVADHLVRSWEIRQSSHSWSATVWETAIERLIGKCRVGGIDEDFVREWVGREGRYSESNPRAADLDRLAQEGVQSRILVELRGSLPDDLQGKLDGWFGGLGAPETPAHQYVTLDQMAAWVGRSKRTLEALKTRTDNPLPDPAVRGGGGKPSEWIWSAVRPWLKKEFNRVLPDRLPTRADRN